MKKTSTSSVETEDARLKIKDPVQQLKNAVEKSANLSRCDAEEMTDNVDGNFFWTSNTATYRIGQIKYSCVKCDEPAGKAQNKCAMVTVRLTLLDAEDRRELCGNQSQRSAALRRRRSQRIADEAQKQGGLLSQDDLAELLMCDVRSIRRDIQCLKDQGIIIPTRGTIRDIKPGLTHTELAVRKWLEGKTPTEIAVAIHHSLKDTEKYLNNFMRVCLLDDNHCSEHEMTIIVGISKRMVRTFRNIREEFKNKTMYKLRMEEIKLAVKEYNQRKNEKKAPQHTRSRRKKSENSQGQ